MHYILPNLDMNKYLPKINLKKGGNYSPLMKFYKLPNETKSIAVIMVDTFYDEDNPNYVRWIMWNVPPVEEIPQGIKVSALVRNPFVAIQGTAGKVNGYTGPFRGFFDKSTHIIRIYAYALTQMLEIPWSSSYKELKTAMKGRILEEFKNEYKF